MITRKNKHEYRVCLGDTQFSLLHLGEIIEWCTMRFGPGGRDKKCRWRYGWVNLERNTFYFRHEKDALFFALSWS